MSLGHIRLDFEKSCRAVSAGNPEVIAAIVESDEAELRARAFKHWYDIVHVGVDKNLTTAEQKLLDVEELEVVAHYAGERLVPPQRSASD